MDKINMTSIGALRYEALRKLNPRQYAELHKRNMDGENFDDMVDALMMTNAHDEHALTTRNANGGCLRRLVRQHFVN